MRQQDFRGVRFLKTNQRWYGQARNNQGKYYTTPSYDKADQAARALDRFLYKLHGQEGCNFPLSAEERQELDGLTLDEISAQFRAGVKSTRSSQFTGVAWNKQKGKWFVKVTTLGSQVGLGLYQQAQDAALMWDAGQILIHGRPPRLSFPDVYAQLTDGQAVAEAERRLGPVYVERLMNAMKGGTSKTKKPRAAQVNKPVKASRAGTSRQAAADGGDAPSNDEQAISDAAVDAGHDDEVGSECPDADDQQCDVSEECEDESDTESDMCDDDEEGGMTDESWDAECPGVTAMEVAVQDGLAVASTGAGTLHMSAGLLDDLTTQLQHGWKVFDALDISDCTVQQDAQLDRNRQLPDATTTCGPVPPPAAAPAPATRLAPSAEAPPLFSSSEPQPDLNPTTSAAAGGDGQQAGVTHTAEPQVTSSVPNITIKPGCAPQPSCCRHAGLSPGDVDALDWMLDVLEGRQPLGPHCFQSLEFYDDDMITVQYLMSLIVRKAKGEHIPREQYSWVLDVPADLVGPLRPAGAPDPNDHPAYWLYHMSKVYVPLATSSSSSGAGGSSGGSGGSVRVGSMPPVHKLNKVTGGPGERELKGPGAQSMTPREFNELVDDAMKRTDEVGELWETRCHLMHLMKPSPLPDWRKLLPCDKDLYPQQLQHITATETQDILDQYKCRKASDSVTLRAHAQQEAEDEAAWLGKDSEWADTMNPASPHYSEIDMNSFCWAYYRVWLREANKVYAHHARPFHVIRDEVHKKAYNMVDMVNARLAASDKLAQLHAKAKAKWMQELATADDPDSGDGDEVMQDATPAVHQDGGKTGPAAAAPPGHNNSGSRV